MFSKSSNGLSENPSLTLTGFNASGGVVTGVVGFERELPNPLSIDSGLLPWFLLTRDSGRFPRPPLEGAYEELLLACDNGDAVL
jgi:hypothetical protein